MENNTSTNLFSEQAQRQLSCFVSLDKNDEMAQSILEELSFSSRKYTNVIAELAASASIPQYLMSSISENACKEE